MNNVLIFTSLLISAVFANLGLDAQKHYNVIKTENSKLQRENQLIYQQIRDKKSLPKQAPVPISAAYGTVLNRLAILNSNSSAKMTVQLEAGTDTDDISTHFEGTVYNGIKGLRIKIVVDKFFQETDMGAVLDDIYLLEMDTDFLVSKITMDNNHLIVKGEIYGI